jgi:nucleoside-diphosphate-sugar epimerase
MGHMIQKLVGLTQWEHAKAVKHGPSGLLYGRDMRLLVTGGSGFIGTNVVEAFMQRGDTVLSIDITAPRNDAHSDVYRNVDIMDRPLLDKVFGEFRPEVVLHFAARADLEQRKGLGHFDANIAGVRNIIDAVRVTGGVQRTIFASTRLVFDLGYQPRHETDYRPSTLYGVSKAKGEDIVRAASDDLDVWTIVRPTGIWGPWFGEPYRSFFEMIARGLYVHPSNRPVYKGYGYVENVVHQLQRLLAAPEDLVNGKTFWLADYQPVVVAEWASQIAEACGSRPIRRVPFPLLRIAAAVGDALGKFGYSFPMTSFRLNNLTTDMTFDTSATEAVVGPLPFSLEEGTIRTIEWLRLHQRRPGV